MDDAVAHEWLAVSRGERAVTWALISQPVETSNTLTAAGRDTVLWAIDQLRRLFEDEWLADAGSDGVSIMTSWMFSPTNPAEHVYRRLLDLGARIALLSGRPAWREFRMQARRNPRFWPHAFLQLEVAGLALRNGWDVALEPKLAGGREGKGDLQLERQGERFLVETTSMMRDDASLAADEFSDAAFWQIRRIEHQRGVSVSGRLLEVVQPSEFEALVLAIDSAAQRSLLSEEPVSVDHASVGLVATARVDQAVTGGSLSGVGIPTDEWQRVARTLRRKASQVSGEVPAWIRLDDTLVLWHLTQASAGPRETMHSALAQLTAELIEDFPHVTGVVLSLFPIFLPNFDEKRYILIDGRGFGLITRAAPLFQREAVFVAREGGEAAAQLVEWVDWYSGEATWLDWALATLGKPSVDQLISKAAESQPG
jgi:hypothetical protein